MKTSNYNVHGLEHANQFLSNSEIRNLDQQNKLNWVGGHRFIADDNRIYFFRENEEGKALFMHITGRKTATFYVAKFK